jgi:hypothetical protein
MEIVRWFCVGMFVVGSVSFCRTLYGVHRTTIDGLSDRSPSFAGNSVSLVGGYA